VGQIAVTIDGKSYRMACDDGQEDHLAALAAMFDGRVQDMRKSFGEIGDMRLAVMAAITLADEIGELKRKVETADAALAVARQSIEAFDQTTVEREADLAQGIARTAERIERIAKTLAAG
jgi:cell division protein ZapA